MPLPHPWTPPSSGGGSRTIADALSEVERRLTRIDHALFLREWAFHTGRSRRGSLAIRLERARLLSHPRLVGWCREARGNSLAPLLRRRLELLEKEAVDTQLEHHAPIARLNDEIERKIHAFRPRWKGRRVHPAEIWDLVSKEAHPGRRERGFYANEPLFRNLEPEVRSLIALRNERARVLGFSSYPEARLSLEGLSVADLREFMEPLPSFARRISRTERERSGLDAWGPWDRMYAQWQEANRLETAFRARDCLVGVRRALRGWGFGAEDLDFRFKRCDTPLAGLAVIGDAPRDVGVIANPRDGYVYYSVLIHEMGHGIHARSVRGSSHLLRNLGPPGYTECVGSLFEEIVSDPAWLRTRPGATPEQVERVRRGSNEETAFHMAELVGEVRSELRLYSSPEADPTTERRAFLKGTLGYDDHDPVSWVDPYHLSPGFYRQSYLLSAIFDAQILAAGLEEVGGDLWPNPEFGRWLKTTWLRPGNRDAWVPKVERVSGMALNPARYVERMQRET